jgi:hypothetical protein
MELQLARTTFTDQSTIGELRINRNHECFTLEDVVRPVKLPGITAIPTGNYEVVITYSERFGRPMPLLLKVPDFDGVRMHWGNTDKNTDGCILVGQTKLRDFIGASRAAFDALFVKLNGAAQIEKIFIAITNASDQATSASVPVRGMTRGMKFATKAAKTRSAKRR